NSTLNAGSAVGPQGIQGVQGPAGADGIDGTNGLDGATGPQGPAGADGIALPFAGTFSDNGPLFGLTQSGTGSGISVNTQSGNGIVSVSDGGAAGNFIITNPANPSNALGAITAGTGVALLAESVSGPAIQAQTGTGIGMQVLSNDLSNTNNTIEAVNFGSGTALYGRSESGFGAFIEITQASNNSHALVTTTAGGGQALFAKSEQGVSARIQNSNSANSNNTLEALTNGTGYAAYLSNSNNTDPKGLIIETLAEKGGNALNIYNGTLAISAHDNYSGATIDDGVLIVTTGPSLTLPVTIGLDGVIDGMTIWVINNTGAQLTITNGYGNPIQMNDKTAKQFLFNTLVSAVDWISVE
ncbi:MAG: hypothetical protein ACKOW2_07525, partial [Sphingobacteriaceae bacterium]